MKDMNFNESVERSVEIRKLYHNLEQQYHKKEWTVEEDALAFLTDAGWVGRLTMSHQGRWPNVIKLKCKKKLKSFKKTLDI